MSEKTISVIVPSKSPWWVSVVKFIAIALLSSIVIVMYYNLIMSSVFPGLVLKSGFPATIDLGQGVVLAFGLVGITKAIRWMQEL